MPATTHWGSVMPATVVVMMPTKTGATVMSSVVSSVTSRATVMSAMSMHIDQFLSLFVKFRFLATEEARITLTYSVAMIIIVVGATKETLMR